jgi:hypothetical protein
VDRVRPAAKSSRSSDYNVIHNKCAAVKIEKKYPTTKQIWMDNHTGPHVAVAAEVRCNGPWLSPVAGTRSASDADTPAPRPLRGSHRPQAHFPSKPLLCVPLFKHTPPTRSREGGREVPSSPRGVGCWMHGEEIPKGPSFVTELH